MDLQESDSFQVYSSGERAWMERGQRWRGRAFAPLVARLTHVGVRPGHVTATSLIVGLFAAAMLLVSPGVALALLALHAFLDGLDGPLARATGVASNQGSFADSTADQVVVAAVGVAAIHTGLAAAWVGLLYVFFYTLVVFFAMWRSAMRAPYSWVLRPRFFIYAWLGVEVYIWPGTLNVVLAASVVLLAWKAWTGFRRIEGLLPGPMRSRRQRSEEE